MRILTLKKLSLAVCLTIPISTYAAGLGKLNVTSNLGEPFRAEIELISTAPNELETLVAKIAENDAYISQGITRLGILNDIKVEVATNKGGTPKLLLRSNQVVSDAYMDLLIQIDWASGRLQREYTVLLDPPGYKDSIASQDIALSTPPTLVLPTNPAPTVEKPIAKPAEPIKAELKPIENKLVKPSDSTEKSATSKVTQVMKSPKSNEVDDNEEEVVDETPATEKRTVAGDTLSTLALEMHVSGVSLNQMLVGLYEANKDAFIDGNMNLLKVGKVIKVPPKETLLANSTSQATQTVVLHTDNWKGYKSGLASSISTSANVESSPKQSDSGKIAAPESHDQNKGTEAKDVVKLSAGDKSHADKNGKKAEDAKKNALAEDKIAHDKALLEAKDRTAAVEKQIEDMQKLLALKSKAMEDLQKKAAADNLAKKSGELAHAENTKAETAKPVETKHEIAPGAKPETKPEVAAPGAKPEVKPEAAPEVKPEEVKPAEEKPVETPAEKPVAHEPPPPVVVAQPVEEPGLFDTLKDNVNLPILGGLGSVVLLGAGWLFLRNKRRKDLDSFERGILTSGGLRANTVFGNTTGNANAADTSFLTDFAQTSEGAMMDTHEVDPIAEAEVYLAYGRDAQAEEILKEAIKKEPKRYELHLKLLEMYADRKDSSAFEALSGEMYTILGAADPVWAKVVEMGITLDPENPLYLGKSTGKVSDVVQPNENKVDMLESEVPILDAVVKPVDNDNSIAYEKPDEPPVAIQDDLRIQQGFDSGSIEDISLDTELEMPNLEQEVQITDDDLADDFDLKSDLTEGLELEATTAKEASMKGLDLSSISLELEDTNAGKKQMEVTVDSDNEVEIKLNLVAAYIDMEDKEGARELLEEVMKEGNEEQIVRAQTMLDSIS